VCRQIEQTAAAGDLAAYLAADRDFHLGMLALASNTRLVEIVSSLRSQTRLLGLPPLVAQKALGGLCPRAPNPVGTGGQGVRPPPPRT
jgi:DNA-binding GntR family transcriptional regulator